MAAVKMVTGLVAMTVAVMTVATTVVATIDATKTAVMTVAMNGLVIVRIGATTTVALTTATMTADTNAENGTTTTAVKDTVAETNVSVTGPVAMLRVAMRGNDTTEQLNETMPGLETHLEAALVDTASLLPDLSRENHMEVRFISHPISLRRRD